MASQQNAFDSGEELISDINVTPLVDVVLVILIIFIMTASMIFKQEIPIDLPSAQTAEASSRGLLNIGVAKDGAITINGKRAALASLSSAVSSARAKLGKKDRLRALVSADVKAHYGKFAQVVDGLRLVGVTDIALDTTPTVEDTEGKR